MIPRPIAVIRTKAKIEDKTMQMILDTLFIYFSLLFDIKTKIPNFWLPVTVA